jgi:Rrf2 family protein
MNISKKIIYGLRAVFELARNYSSNEVIRIHQIALEQDIPQRFLEGILNELRKGGFIVSKRGKEGGYLLARPPKEISVGEVMDFLYGPLTLAHWADERRQQNIPSGDRVFMPVWERARQAASAIYNKTTFQDLVEEYARHGEGVASNYVI